MIYASQLFNSKIIERAVASMHIEQRSFLFFFHLHRRSTITRLRSTPGANNPPARSHFHNSHTFRLFRASRESSGWPRRYPRSCAPATSGASSEFALRNIAISTDDSLEEVFRKRSRRGERATIVARSSGANFISFARAVPSASRKNLREPRPYSRPRGRDASIRPVCKTRPIESTNDKKGREGGTKERVIYFRWMKWWLSPIKSDDHPFTRD